MSLALEQENGGITGFHVVEILLKLIDAVVALNPKVELLDPDMLNPERTEPNMLVDSV